MFFSFLTIIESSSWSITLHWPQSSTLTLSCHQFHTPRHGFRRQRWRHGSTSPMGGSPWLSNGGNQWTSNRSQINQQMDFGQRTHSWIHDHLRWMVNLVFGNFFRTGHGKRLILLIVWKMVRGPIATGNWQLEFVVEMVVGQYQVPVLYRWYGYYMSLPWMVDTLFVRSIVDG